MILQRRNSIFVALVLAGACTAAQAAAGSPPPAEGGRYASTPAAPVRDYTVPQFDLSGLPAYVPQEQPVGTVRLTGTPLDSLVGDLTGAFKDIHKRVRFTSYLVNTSQGMAGLIEETADIGIMGHATWLSSRKAFEEAFGYAPLEIKFGKGSYDDPKGSTPGIVFFVNKDNPLQQLTIEQIDGIFGAARTGGWDGTCWTTAPARGPEKDIRTWGQLGLTGKWAKQPIAVHGTDITLSNWADLIEKIAFEGGTRWNPALREGPRADLVHGNFDKEIVNAVDADPNAIGFMFKRAIDAVGADVGVLPIVPRGGGKAVAPSNQTFFSSKYPFHNNVYLYINRKPGTRLPAREREFLRFILSREGQAIIAADRRFIPLNAEEIQAELRKIDEN